MRFFLNRAGGQTTERIHHIASFIKSLARHWTRPGEETIQEFVLLCSRLAPGRRGMTARNRERLRQFDDPANLAALLRLPKQLADEARALARDHAGRQAALLLMFAVAIALLTSTPVRAENLSGLRLDRHIVRSRPGAGGVVHLVIPESEIKTAIRQHHRPIARQERVTVDAPSGNVPPTKSRLSWPLRAWPHRDQAAWEQAMRAGDPLDPGGIGAAWSPASRRKTALSYGRFIGWLAGRGELDPAAAPEDRVTRDPRRDWRWILRAASRIPVVQAMLLASQKRTLVGRCIRPACAISGLCGGGERHN